MEVVLDKKQVKEFLSKSIVNSINKKIEFIYLEEMANVNKKPFDNDLINYCLDKYIELRKQGEENFKSKYASMWVTAWKILYG